MQNFFNLGFTSPFQVICVTPPPPPSWWEAGVFHRLFFQENSCLLLSLLFFSSYIYTPPDPPSSLRTHPSRSTDPCKPGICYLSPKISNFALISWCLILSVLITPQTAFLALLFPALLPACQLSVFESYSFTITVLSNTSWLDFNI